MHWIRRGGLAALLGIMGVATATLAGEKQSADGTIAAKPITYADLGKLVRTQRGKVIVVDFWSVY